MAFNVYSTRSFWRWHSTVLAAQDIHIRMRMLLLCTICPVYSTRSYPLACIRSKLRIPASHTFLS
jgi:hypothetical protein